MKNNQVKNWFNFKEWKECFEEFKKRREQIPDLKLIISTHLVTSGYWIDNPNDKVLDSDKVYQGKEADLLMKKVEETINIALKENKIVDHLIF